MALEWLNGWHLNGPLVLLGSGAHCAGCGKLHGVVCVVIPEGWVPPAKAPDWPFPVDSCPVCDRLAQEFDSWPPRAVDLYLRLKASEATLAAMGREHV